MGSADLHFSVNRFSRFDQKRANYKTLFFFKEKQGLAKVNHYISHITGIVLNFNKIQITQPLFTSQGTNDDYQRKLKVESLHLRYRQVSTLKAIQKSP
jgi:hypothetical protein